MCGFAGILGDSSELNWEPAQVLASIDKRGPDASGVAEADWFKVAHARLSIIDLDPRADQPMWDESKRYCLVFNGEIYNYRELKESLAASGTQFQTESDSEVLLHLLINQGVEALNALHGCFAFCFMDSQTKSAIVARDRFGINPLYFSKGEGSLICSSSFKAITKIKGGIQVSQAAVSSLMQFSFATAPHSCDDQIEKLLPGHCLEFSEGETTMRKWYLVDQPKSTSNVISLLEESIVERMVSDVPVGTFLSGGLDSSLITALAAKHHPGITAFSIGFENEFLDESRWSKQMADQLDVDHRLLVVTETQMLDDFETYLDDIDEPFGDSSSMAMWALSRMAGNEVKVCLSGDGADELFGGYNRHRAFWHWHKNSFKSQVAGFLGKYIGAGSRENSKSDWKRKISAFASLKGIDSKEIYLHLSSFTDRQLCQEVFGAGLKLPFEIDDQNALQSYLMLDQAFILPNDMLHKVDVMSMAHGLEVRTPFLDHRLVEWANAQGADEKFNGSEGKIMLRQAAREWIPGEILDRPKSGFEIPVESWLRGPLRPYLTQAISQIKNDLGWINAERLDSILSEFESGASHHSSLMWTTMILGQWLKRN